MKKTNPLCLIYCASPGSFLKLDQLSWLIETCMKSKIFVCLVCTNKYAGNQAAVVADFKSMLSKCSNETRDEDGIIYYDDVALCTTVNNIEYVDTFLKVKQPKEGVNELIYGIMVSLKPDLLVGWCYAIEGNDSFWNLMKQKLTVAFGEFIRQHGTDIAKSFLDFALAFVRHKYLPAAAPK
ncbi:unnamed protein product [Didymodactylos carnosus]|uniref:Uncharacterized protein n=1 Tax=Didymodactylos carnosus TaxID=1234261 RepID=A0A814DB47_9BILA|nr:unnamed protein product [Didymodactylos carnosus]CAF1325934.1 unnamed protein product [Didymodactylos carnosus]CAF3729910.1 unnamed protein product [Didymodactylos carnosus]CAF4137039.1 unnamed protein product [Didymodactylos carnosus]